MKTTESNISVQDKLSVVLKEYEAIRDEIVRLGDRQLQLFYIMVSILSIAYGYIMTQRVLDTLYIVPLVISPFIHRYIWEQRNVEIMGKYIKEEIEEKRIPAIIGYRSSESRNVYERYWMATLLG